MKLTKFLHENKLQFQINYDLHTEMFVSHIKYLYIEDGFRFGYGKTIKESVNQYVRHVRGKVSVCRNHAGSELRRINIPDDLI